MHLSSIHLLANKKILKFSHLLRFFLIYYFFISICLNPPRKHQTTHPSLIVTNRRESVFCFPSNRQAFLQAFGSPNRLNPFINLLRNKNQKTIR